MLDVCTTAWVDDRTVPLADVRAGVESQFEQLSTQGFRVLALATRCLPGQRTATEADETVLTLRGLLAFHDPPKPGMPAAIETLNHLGVSLRLVTGDNRHAAHQVAGLVGLHGDVMTGPDIDALDDTDLTQRVATVSVFAEVEPLHKERLVEALQASGEAVGFLGDGVNDAAALHAADVGISVDTAVDVAKQAAAIVLLDKSLTVVADSVHIRRAKRRPDPGPGAACSVRRSRRGSSWVRALLPRASERGSRGSRACRSP